MPDPTNPTFLEAQCRRLVSILPWALDLAMDSYCGFVTAGLDLGGAADSKDFKDHHTNARTALVHMEALFKLAHWASLPKEEAMAAVVADPDGIGRMVAEAGHALAALRVKAAARKDSEGGEDGGDADADDSDGDAA